VWDLETGRELRTLTGHSNPVFGVVVSSDWRRAVSASYTLKLWDLETGAELRTLAGHSSPIFGVAVSPNWRRAVSASLDHTVNVWDLETGANVATFNCDAAAYRCAFASDRTIIAGDQGGHIHFLSLEL
jgi:WD40 repeat protein